MHAKYYKTLRTPWGVRFFWSLATALLLFGLSGCDSSANTGRLKLTGQTMGTSYSVVVSGVPSELTAEVLQDGLSTVLFEVNQQMSNWVEDSEISRFNRSESTEWFDVSPATAMVVAESLRIHDESEGAFDVTVAPLIDAWGFGPSGLNVDPPTDAELAALRSIIGSEKLDVRKDPAAIRKTHSKVTINLSAIAKGYGVDTVAIHLESLGIRNYLVEIGGEIRVSGHKSDGSSWRLGIERPREEGRSIQDTVSLTDQAMATSGDYRNFIEIEGKKYSHTINPVTLKPISHRLASVTVLAETCLEADGLATTLMVMGPQKGYDWAEQNQLAVLMLVHADDGFDEQSTTAWKQLTGTLP